jgi:carbonic anhydrase/acetyltransferase-like protein (isoleucine patch superfamily)
MFIDYKGKAPRVAASAFVAPNAILIGDVVVGEGSSIWFGVVLRADTGKIRIGARSNDVTVGHCAVLDDCTIHDGALIGSNAVVLNGATIGAHTLIAAGSVVTAMEQVPESIVAAGAPAKVRKLLSGRAAEWIAHSTSESIEQAQAYRRDNIGNPQAHEVKSSARRRRGSVLAEA